MAPKSKMLAGSKRSAIKSARSERLAPGGRTTNIAKLVREEVRRQLALLKQTEAANEPFGASDRRRYWAMVRSEPVLSGFDTALVSAAIEQYNLKLGSAAESSMLFHQPVDLTAQSVARWVEKIQRGSTASDEAVNSGAIQRQRVVRAKPKGK